MIEFLVVGDLWVAYVQCYVEEFPLKRVKAFFECCRECPGFGIVEKDRLDVGVEQSYFVRGAEPF